MRIDGYLLGITGNCDHSVLIRIDLYSVNIDIRDCHLDVVDCLKLFLDIDLNNTCGTGNIKISVLIDTTV